MSPDVTQMVHVNLYMAIGKIYSFHLKGFKYDFKLM